MYRGIHGDQLGSIGFKGDQWVQWVSKGTHKDPKGSIGIHRDPMGTVRTHMIHQLRLAALLLITLPEGNMSRRRGAFKGDLGQVGGRRSLRLFRHAGQILQ